MALLTLESRQGPLEPLKTIGSDQLATQEEQALDQKKLFSLFGLITERLLQM